MSVVPTATVTLGSLRYDQQVVGLVVRLAALPEVSGARVTLPAAVRLDAVPGDPAQVDVGGVAVSGDEGPDTVLTGTVVRIRRGFDLVAVQVADAAAALATLRPAATYTAGTAADVVTALLGDAGAIPGDIQLDLPLAAYVADQSRPATEHVARLAALSGGLATVGGDGAVSAVPLPTEPTVALRYGRDFTDYEVAERAAPAVQLVAVGAGPAGAAGAPDALRPSAEPLPADAPDPGPDAVRVPEPVLRTPAAASTAGKAAQALAAARARRLRARCVLLPALRPGDVVEVQELPAGSPPGPWLLTRVEHRFTPGRGGTTTLDGLDAGAAAAGGLAGLLAAIGGLL